MNVVFPDPRDAVNQFRHQTTPHEERHRAYTSIMSPRTANSPVRCLIHAFVAKADQKLQESIIIQGPTKLECLFHKKGAFPSINGFNKP